MNNCCYSLLRLVAIVPSGKSKLFDTIGMVIWSGLALTPVILVIIDQKNAISAALYKPEIFSFFLFLSTFFNAILRASLTFPAIHFLALKNAWLFRVPAKLPGKIVIFALDVLLATCSCMSMIYCIQQVMSSYIFMIMTIAGYLLMVLSTYIIGTSMAQLSSDDIEPGGGGDPSSKLAAFISLKTGISPLLFLVYIVKVLMLIVFPVMIFTGLKRDMTPLWVSTVNVAYASVDIFYINSVATDAYACIQTFMLHLRYILLFSIHKHLYNNPHGHVKIK